MSVVRSNGSQRALSPRQGPNFSALPDDVTRYQVGSYIEPLDLATRRNENRVMRQLYIDRLPEIGQSPTILAHAIKSRDVGLFRDWIAVNEHLYAESGQADLFTAILSAIKQDEPRFAMELLKYPNFINGAQDTIIELVACATPNPAKRKDPVQDQCRQDLVFLLNAFFGLSSLEEAILVELLDDGLVSFRDMAMAVGPQALGGLVNFIDRHHLTISREDVDYIIGQFGINYRTPLYQLLVKLGGPRLS